MTTATATALSVTKLHARRDGRDVLRDISFVAEAGEAVAIAGPNGGGKTTLLLCLAGLAPFGGGAIDINGESAESAGRLGHVGYLPQRTASTGALPVTPRQAIQLAAGPRDVDVDWLGKLERVLLGDVEPDRPVASLSGGQQQLVAIAKSLAHRPKLLLLDEPTLGLAPPAVARLVEAVEMAREELSATVVISTHDHLAALRLSNRLVYLDRSIRYDGPANAVPPALDARLCHHE
ncbi:MAG: ATP-binding cassette domain-containing protein [Planctomycetota bacterium]